MIQIRIQKDPNVLLEPNPKPNIFFGFGPEAKGIQMKFYENKKYN